jgi:nucleotide-binding universal stress UspA family protein
MTGERSMPGLEATARHPEPRASASTLIEMVVFVDGRLESERAVEWAARLARAHRARLTGVFTGPAPVYSQPEMFARGDGLAEVIAAGEDQRRRIETQWHERLQAAVRRQGVDWVWRPVRAVEPSDLVVHAQFADLAVVSRDQADPPHALDNLPETLVLTSGRPIVLLPAGGAAGEPRRILLAWKARPEAVRAVAGALPLLTRADAVQVVVVDDEGAPECGYEPGADIALHLARHGARVEVLQLSSRGGDVGRLLLSQGTAFGADLLVMGAYGHSRLRERLFGGVTRTVLTEAALPVLMCR